MIIKTSSKYINPIVLKETYNNLKCVVKSSKKKKCKQTKQFKRYESLHVYLKASISSPLGFSIPISVMPKSHHLLTVVLINPRQINADLRGAKEVLARIPEIVWA